MLIRLQDVGSSTAEELRHRGDDARTFDAREQQPGAPLETRQASLGRGRGHAVVPITAGGSVISLLQGCLGAPSVPFSSISADGGTVRLTA